MGNYSVVKNSVAYKAKLIPDEMIQVTNNHLELVNAFGTNFYVSSRDKAASGDKKMFSIGFGEIPPEACIE